MRLPHAMLIHQHPYHFALTLDYVNVNNSPFFRVNIYTLIIVFVEFFRSFTHSISRSLFISRQTQAEIGHENETPFTDIMVPMLNELNASYLKSNCLIKICNGKLQLETWLMSSQLLLSFFFSFFYKHINGNIWRVIFLIALHFYLLHSMSIRKKNIDIDKSKFANWTEINGKMIEKQS